MDDGTEVPLPVSAVRFAPTLDRHNTAPAGKPFLVLVKHPRGEEFVSLRPA
jgi:hypothetical protein